MDNESSTDFICFCPYHNNNQSPSFAVSMESGMYFCFNPACGMAGNLMDLVQKIGNMTFFQAARLLNKSQVTGAEFTKKLQGSFAEYKEFEQFDPQLIVDRHADLWESPKALEYLHSRGFTDETLSEFQIGYSAKRDLIMTPMHDPYGMPVGVIGRSPSSTNKVFKNSKGLPTSKTLWNYHRAKKAGGTAIIVEANFDAMRVHQAGHHGVVALLMGHFSDYHKTLLDRSMEKIIIMTDEDAPKFYDNCRKCGRSGLNLCVGHRAGQELGNKIADVMHGKRIYWAHYDNKSRFPEGCKDAGDMTDDQIRQCIRNAKSNYEYNMLYAMH